MNGASGAIFLANRTRGLKNTVLFIRKYIVYLIYIILNIYKYEKVPPNS